MVVVTGATGQLGRLVINELLRFTAGESIVAAVRTPSKATSLSSLGVQVREADYSNPDTLTSAFVGASRVLLISGNELDKRVAQHKAIIDAAKAAGANFVAYTSILHCDTSPLILAKEHLATERDLLASGLAYSMLRNGWYYENQTAGIPQAVHNGVFIGASGNGRFSAAARSDYATAAALVLARKEFDNSILELGGDESYTRAELAAEVSRQTGKDIRYKDLSEEEFRSILAKFLPTEMASAIADAEARAAKGALEDHSRTLSHILGKPTATLSQAVASALRNTPAAH